MTMPKWTCPHCYHMNNSHATYCLKCGYYKEDAKTDFYWTCPECQEENSNHTLYCIKCGHHYEEFQSKPAKNPKETSKWPKLTENARAILIVELIIIGIASFISIYNKESVSDIFLSILIVHLFFGLYYIMVAFIKSGFGEMMKSIFIQGGIIIGMLIVAGLTSGATGQTGLNAYSLNYLKNHAIEVDYDELHQIAFERYGSQRKQLVKFSGKVFLLDGTEYMMIDMSTEPLKNQVVYVKRKEQDYEVGLNDQVEIYGKVLGTASTAKHLEEQMTVPVIESYSLLLR